MLARERGPRWQIHAQRRNLRISVRPGHPGDFRDTIPYCLGELGEIRESKQRTGTPADEHPTGTFGALGVERLGDESEWSTGRAAASGEKRIDLSVGCALFGAILKERGLLVAIGPRLVFANSTVGCRQ